MEIHVINLRGDRLSMQVNEDSKFINIKERIEKEMNIPIERQTLTLFDARFPLPDDQYIECWDKQVKPGSKIMLFVKQPKTLRAHLEEEALAKRIRLDAEYKKSLEPKDLMEILREAAEGPCICPHVCPCVKEPEEPKPEFAWNVWTNQNLIAHKSYYLENWCNCYYHCQCNTESPPLIY